MHEPDLRSGYDPADRLMREAVANTAHTPESLRAAVLHSLLISECEHLDRARTFQYRLDRWEGPHTGDFTHNIPRWRDEAIATAAKMKRARQALLAQPVELWAQFL